MGVNSLPKTVTRQRRDCNLNPGPSAPESNTLTARLPSQPKTTAYKYQTPFVIQLAGRLKSLIIIPAVLLPGCCATSSLVFPNT